MNAHDFVGFAVAGMLTGFGLATMMLGFVHWVDLVRSHKRNRR